MLSNLVDPGGTITVAGADVLLINSPGGFANAAAVAADLLAHPITFATAQTDAFNHYVIAYQDLGGNVRLADMDIHRGAAPFTTTAQGATLSVSDMVQLSGVSLASLQPGNVNFLHGTEQAAAIAHSSYLDFTGYGVTDATSVAAAYHLDPNNISLATTAGINVAIVLDRAQDPTTLLGENWGERQQALAQLNGSGTLWSTYGADQNQFNAVEQSLSANYHLTVLDGTNSNYVSSAESRTVWVELNSAADFSNLFGTALYQYTDSNNPANDFVFWNGNLALPQGWNTAGLWIDTENSPPPSNMTPGVSATPAQGWQSPGNASSQAQSLTPQQIAALYHMPLDGLGVPTGTIGLVEPGIGSALPAGQTQTFQQLLAAYQAGVGASGSGTVYVQGANGQVYSTTDGATRSLDVGVASAINPDSDIGLYGGSGHAGNAQASVYTALQSAIWDTVNNPGVISNSFSDSQHMSPNSPFYEAYQQLFVDAALRNISVFNALGDSGSGNDTGNGLTNLEYSLASPYAVVVGGTSISSFAAAEADPDDQQHHRRLGAGRQPVDDLATRRGRIDRPADRRGPPAVLRRDGVEPVLRRRHADHQPARHPGGGGRRRSHASDAVVSARVRPQPGDHRSAGPARPRRARRRRRRRRQHRLHRAQRRHGGHHVRRRRHRRRLAAVGLAHRAAERDLPRPGPAQPGLHERPALHRLGGGAGLVQRRDARHQHLVLHRGRRLREQRPRPDADRLRLQCRPGLRPRLGPGHAQRPVAGAHARRHRPFGDVVRLDARRDRCERAGRLDQRRRPEPLVPDDVRRRHPCRRADRPRRLRLLQRGVG